MKAVHQCQFPLTFEEEDLSSDVCYSVKTSLTAIIKWGIQPGTEQFVNNFKGCNSVSTPLRVATTRPWIFPSQFILATLFDVTHWFVKDHFGSWECGSYAILSLRSQKKHIHIWMRGAGAGVVGSNYWPQMQPTLRLFWSIAGGQGCQSNTGPQFLRIKMELIMDIFLGNHQIIFYVNDF